MKTDTLKSSIHFTVEITSSNFLEMPFNDKKKKTAPKEPLFITSVRHFPLGVEETT